MAAFALFGVSFVSCYQPSHELSHFSMLGQDRSHEDLAHGANFPERWTQEGVSVSDS